MSENWTVMQLQEVLRERNITKLQLWEYEQNRFNEQEKIK